MITRRDLLALAGGALLPATASARLIEDPSFETPFFAPAVDIGALPPVGMRLPQHPRVVDLGADGRLAGRHGGTIRMIIGGQRDIRLMPLIGYARLVGYDAGLNLVADVLESYQEIGECSFTFRLRVGHRWSDGSELTSEDFRYFWEDVALNDELSPGGPPRELLVHGEPPRVTILDRWSIRYEWRNPHPDFLSKLADPVPARLFLPSAYMRRFHKRYQSAAELDRMIRFQRVDDWAGLHQKMSRQNRPENPDLPTLDPWRPRTAPPAEQFVFERNPYFHRVDELGRQLPYIDRFLLNVSSPEIISAKVGSGESDLQFLGVDFADYTYLKAAEAIYPIKVDLWRRSQGSRLTLRPNLNYGNPVWRDLLRDARFRRALSVAIDRREINLANFFGLATPSADTILPESPLYRPEYAAAWSSHDPALADRLLDELGLTGRDADGMRLLPDGRSATVVVETAGESTLETDVLELVTDHWRAVGIPLLVRVTQRDVFRKRAMGGDLMMSVWTGMDNGVPTADMPPLELAPTADDQLQWPVWGLHYLSNGAEGRAPDLPAAARLADLLTEWQNSANSDNRAKVWGEMLSIYTDNVFSIGIVNATLQPVIRSSRLVNVPEKGLFGFNPTSYLGIYQPDTFWKRGN